MAKNWSVAEALQVVTAGKNLEAIKDIGRRFPLFLFFVLHNPLKIIEAFGPRVTARTVNKQLEGELNVGEQITVEERAVKPERMDHMEKGAKLGKSREGKKGDKKERPKEEKESEENKKREEIKDKKLKENEIDDLDFDVEDLLEESED